MVTKPEFMTKVFLDYIREGDAAMRIRELDDSPSWTIPGTVWSRLASKVYGRGRSRYRTRQSVYNYWRAKATSVRSGVLKELAKDSAPIQANGEATLPPAHNSEREEFFELTKEVLTPSGLSSHRLSNVDVGVRLEVPDEVAEYNKNQCTCVMCYTMVSNKEVLTPNGLSSHRLSDVDVGIRLEVPDEAAKSNKCQCTCVMCYTSHCLPGVGEGVHLEMLKKEVPSSPGHDLKSAHFTRSEVFCGVEHSKRKTAAKRNCEQSHETRVSSFENSTKMKNEIDSEFDASDKMAGTSWSMLDITDIHEQEENFCICDECGQMFTRPWLLKQHQKSLHLREFENLLYKCSFCSLRYDTEIGLKEHVKSLHASELEEIKQESKELFGELNSPQDHHENDKGSVWYYGNYCLKDLRVCLERISMKTIAVNKELVCETADHKAPASGQKNLTVFVDGFQENCTDSPLLRVNCRKEVDVSTFESSLLTSGNDANLEVSKSIASEREDSDLPEDLESDVLVGATDKVENGISSVIPMESYSTKAVPQPKKILERFGHNNCLERFITSFGYENPSRNESLLKTTNSVFLEMPKEGQYVCPVCGDRFARRVQLEQHSRLHKQSAGVQQKDGLCHCSICGLKFQYLYALQKHVVDNHGPEALASNVSGSTESESQAVNEQRSANYQPSQNLYPFINNRVAFTRLLLIRNHQLSNKQSKKKKCTHCGLMYDGLESLNKHYRLHEAAKDCNNSLNRLAGVQNGQPGEVQSGELHVPLDCQKNNGSSSGIITFLEEPNSTTQKYISPNTVQKDALPYECKDGRVQYSCDFCPSVWNSPSLLLLHMQMYHKVDPSQGNRLCEDCGISFDSLESFEEHKVKHLIEKLVEENAGVIQQAFARRDPIYTEARVINGGGTEPVGSTSDCTNSNGCVAVARVINGGGTEPVGSTLETTNNNGCIPVEQVINGRATETVRFTSDSNNNGCVAVAQVINGGGTEPVGSALENTNSNECVTVAQVINGGVAQVVNGGVAYIINGGVAHVINGGVAHVINGGVSKIINGGVAHVINSGVAQVFNGGVAHVINGGVPHVINGRGTEPVGSTLDNTNNNGCVAVAQVINGGVAQVINGGVAFVINGGVAYVMNGGVAHIVNGGVAHVSNGGVAQVFNGGVAHVITGGGTEPVCSTSDNTNNNGDPSFIETPQEMPEERPHEMSEETRQETPQEMPQETAKVVPKRGYVCDQCDERFEDNFTKLLQHRLSHGEEGVALPQFWCLSCGHGSHTADEIELHLKGHTYHRRKKGDKGNKYGRDFLYIADLRNCLSASNDKIFACDKCNRSYSTVTSLQLHLYKHGEKRLKCDRCPKTFHFPRELNAHKLSHVGQHLYTCSVCGKGLAGKGALKLHMYIHTGEFPYKCSICPRAFRSAGNLKRHSLVHLDDAERAKHGTKPVQCSICNKMLSCRSSLKIHLVLHQGVKQHICTLCRKPFALAGGLRIHMMKCHSDERPFPCCVCDKSFKGKSDLKMHLVLHSRPGTKHDCKYPDDRCAFAKNVKAKTFRVHACPLCGKACPNRSKLKSHMQIHDKEAVACSCNVCGKVFRHTYSLRVHMRLHTGDKPYGCKVCGKRFTQAGNLSIHLRMHTGERPYQCKICLRPFRYLSWMKIHLRAHKSLELIDAPESRIQRRILHKDSNGKITNNGSEQKSKSNKKTKQRDLDKARLSQAEASLPLPTTYLSNKKTKKRDLDKARLSQAEASLPEAEASLPLPTTYLSNKKTKKGDLDKARLFQAEASLFQAEASLPKPTPYLSPTANEETDYYPCGLDVPNEAVGEYLDASNNGISECFPYGNEGLFADYEQPGEPIYEEIVG